jgi:UDP-N-acetylmuramyl pentapeptide phosphotransferase/UDP-N-acetylglucosamine-1-phosphate transferase
MPRMLILLVAFVASLSLTLVMVRSAEAHAQLINDHDLSGPQKFHTRPVPRIGGVGLMCGVLVATLAMSLRDADGSRLAWAVLACAMPTFVAGLSEDLTKKVSPRRRLFFTAISAVLAIYWPGAVIDHTGVAALDWIFSFPAVAAVSTVFAVVGVANSVNIIDGFNGLASMCSMLILVSLAYVAFQVGDVTIGLMALAGVGAVFGFFVWNFPGGLIFLGDGGAYFLGFYIAEVAILLIQRNPDVSPMFPMLLCVYPVFETLFSIYRRRFIRAQAPSVPDGIHLHSLIYRRVMRWAVGTDDSDEARTRRNSMTSPYLWMLCMTAVIPAVLFWDSTPVLLGFMTVFVITYVVLYWRIVRFQSPRWMLYHT